MGYYYATERRKFEANFDKFRQECKEAGMSEEDIESMYEFDRAQLNTRRDSIDRPHEPDGDTVDEGRSLLTQRFPNHLSDKQPEISEWGRYDWLEDIDTPELTYRLRLLSDKEIELITHLLADDSTRAEWARKTGVSRAAVTKQINQIKNILRNPGYNG